MQQRQPGQHSGVEPVGLGVLVVIVTQIGGLLGRDQDHLRALGTKPCRQRHPGIAGWLHDHHHLAGIDPHGQQRP